MNLIRILNQTIKFNKLPSEIIRCKDEYTSYCFDEACFYILRQLEDGKKVNWLDDDTEMTKEEKREMASSLADMLRKGGGAIEC